MIKCVVTDVANDFCQRFAYSPFYYSQTKKSAVDFGLAYSRLDLSSPEKEIRLKKIGLEP